MWDKVLIETNEYGVEVLTGVLISCGITGMELIQPEERVRFLDNQTGIWDYAEDELLSEGDSKTYVVFYVEKNESGKEQIAKVKTEIERLVSDDILFDNLSVSIETLTNSDWETEWKKHFKSIHLDGIVIVPAWESYIPLPGEIVLKIDPGSAFGTGQHQSTQLAIRALAQYVKQGMTVLDIGCGSGILSLVALKLEASFCFACDIDEFNAMFAVKHNATINNISSNAFTVQSGDVLSNKSLMKNISKFQYDIVIANIVADVVSSLAPFAFNLLRPGGLYIATGVISEKKENVEECFLAAGFTSIQIIELDGWVLLSGVANA